MKKFNYEEVKLFIATPCFGGMVSESYMISIINLINKLYKLRVTVAIKTLANESLITRARNQLAAEFVNTDFTHMLFIDADISFEVESVLRLLIFNHPLTAGTYPKKEIPWEKVIDKVQKGTTDPKKLEASSLDYAIYPTNETKMGFINSKYAPTGFMLIKKEVLTKMIEKYPEKKYTSGGANGYNQIPFAWDLFDCTIDKETDTYLSEDYSFCKRWKEMGGDIWVDGKSKLTHIGQYRFKGDYNCKKTS